jgi:hypothetical protein
MGLVGVSTPDLKRLFGLLVHGELQFPLGPWELARSGFQPHSEELLGTLRGLDEAGVRAVLTAVLAERLERLKNH